MSSSKMDTNVSVSTGMITEALNNSNLAKFVVGWVIFEFCALVILVLWKVGVLNCCRNRVKEFDERVSHRQGHTKGKRSHRSGLERDIEIGENLLY